MINLFGGDKYKAIIGLDELTESIKNKIEGFKNLKFSEKEKQYRDIINQQKIIIDKLTKDVIKYYDFYQKHTYKFGDEGLTPLSDIQSQQFIECPRCHHKIKFNK